mmetsp:Transcript_4855/g.12162  ORF Transcript_4855/g.12162 Transcript_4855/m.12162 type:complete len:266 (+) Transcript_4855:495-1292(+)
MAPQRAPARLRVGGRGQPLPGGHVGCLPSHEVVQPLHLRAPRPVVAVQTQRRDQLVPADPRPAELGWIRKPHAIKRVARDDKPILLQQPSISLVAIADNRLRAGRQRWPQGAQLKSGSAGVKVMEAERMRLVVDHVQEGDCHCVLAPVQLDGEGSALYGTHAPAQLWQGDGGYVADRGGSKVLRVRIPDLPLPAPTHRRHPLILQRLHVLRREEQQRRLRLRGRHERPILLPEGKRATGRTRRRGAARYRQDAAQLDLPRQAAGE